MANEGSTTPPIAVEIVERMAEVMEVREVAIPPLSNSLDTDALESLVAVEGAAEGDVTIQFEFQDHLVQVDSNRDIDVS